MNWIKKEAMKLVNKYSTNDPFELASLLNIQVIPYNLHEEILGFYLYDRKNRYIFINSNLDDFYKRYTCTHELGHAEIHTKISTPFMRKSTLFSVDKIEVEANRYAVEILMPDSTFDFAQTLQMNACKHGIPFEVAHLKTN